METVIKNITKRELKSLGLTDYLIKEIVKGLKAMREAEGFYVYPASDVKTSVEKKLANPRTQETSKEKLRKVINWLEGKSNLIQVDFLQNLPPEKKIFVLKERLEELEVREKELIQETNKLLREVKTV